MMWSWKVSENNESAAAHAMRPESCRDVPLSLGLILALICCLAPGMTPAAEKAVSFTTEVAAGRWTGARLRNLNAGATLAIEVETSGPVEVSIQSGQYYERFAMTGVITEALFRSSISDRLSFSIRSPKTDDYYLVIDNRAGTSASKLNIHAKASLELPDGEKKPATVVETQVNAAFSQLEESLRKAFVFGNLRIRLARCNHANAYSSRDEIYLCAEFLQYLLERVKDKEKIRHLLLFALMHELGHSLFSQWQYPFSDNEELVDEFATLLLMMFNQREVVQAQADFFAWVSPEPEVQRQLVHDDRHPISIQRSRNLHRWLGEQGLIEKWQPFLIPHMQTSFLHTLEKRRVPWLPKDLLRKELQKRSQEGSGPAHP